MEESTVLVADHLVKMYNNVVVLEDFSIVIRPGEVHALFGHNGAGKSTVIRMLSGTEVPTTGSLEVEGNEVHFKNPLAAQRAGIYTVYQELHLIEEMTVEENVYLGRELHRNGVVDRASMRNATLKLLAEHHSERLHPDTRVKTLPHAQKQLIEIISALHNDARLILLDEPTTALEKEEIDRLLQIIRELRKKGVSFLFITHKLDEAFAVSDYVHVLRNGKTVMTGAVADISHEQVVRYVIGKTLEETKADSFEKVSQVNQTSVGECLLEMSNVAASGLQDVSLRVHRGEVLGLYGLVGSGRTEVLETIFGVRKVTGGSMTLQGHKYHPKSPAKALESGVRLLTEERKKSGIIPQLDGRINMGLAALNTHQNLGFILKKKLYGAIAEMGQKLSIKGDLNQAVVRLSGGNQQKVLLARWLLLPGDLLLLDEPTKGVDIGVKQEIHGIIRELSQSGYAVIVVSSEVEEIMEVSNRIAVMVDGRMLDRVFDVADTTEEQLLRRAMGV